jgi:hypothetical protein
MSFLIAAFLVTLDSPEPSMKTCPRHTRPARRSRSAGHWRGELDLVAVGVVNVERVDEATVHGSEDEGEVGPGGEPGVECR